MLAPCRSNDLLHHKHAVRGLIRQVKPDSSSCVTQRAAWLGMKLREGRHEQYVPYTGRNHSFLRVHYFLVCHVTMTVAQNQYGNLNMGS